MEIQGLLIFMGIVGAYTFIILGCMERRLKDVARAVEDSKYVN